jgi:hypothetical protein
MRRIEAVSANYFADDYFAARERFIAATRAAGARHYAWPIAACGPRNETLTIDCAWLGAERPRRLLILSSGIHGVEGFAGSAMQTLFLTELAAASWPPDTGMLLIHALNPYGFAHLRRVNENGVDLNRNALATFPGPPNPGYRRLDRWLNPESPPTHVDGFALRALWHLLNMGSAAVRQAVAGGQYEFPRGLFFGGESTQESIRIFESLVGDPRLTDARVVHHLDLHSGLGPYGHCRLFVEAPPSSTRFRRWQEGFGNYVTVGGNAAAPGAYHTSGALIELTVRRFPNASVATATLECGTYSPFRVLKALRDENRLYHHGDPASASGKRIRNRLYQTFCPATEGWRRGAIAEARDIFRRLPEALAADEL